MSEERASCAGGDSSPDLAWSSLCVWRRRATAVLASRRLLPRPSTTRPRAPSDDGHDRAASRRARRSRTARRTWRTTRSRVRTARRRRSVGPATTHGVVTCLGGRFYVQGDINKAFGFGIYAGSADDVGRRRRVPPGPDHQLRAPAASRSRSPSSPIAWCSVATRTSPCTPRSRSTNPTNGVVGRRSRSRRPGSFRSRPRPTAWRPHASAVHDYVAGGRPLRQFLPVAVAASVGGRGELRSALRAHARVLGRTAAQDRAGRAFPTASSNDAYRSGFIYTLIARSGIHSNTGVNNYEAEFSHDVIGILANLFTQGDYDDAHALLLDARDVVGSPEYVDGAVDLLVAVGRLPVEDRRPRIRQGELLHVGAGRARPSRASRRARIASPPTGPVRTASSA